MVDHQAIHQVELDAVLGFFGVTYPTRKYNYYAIVDVEGRRFILYFFKNSYHIFEPAILRRYSTIELFISLTNDRSPNRIETDIQLLDNLQDHMLFDYPELKPISHTQLIAALLLIKGPVSLPDPEQFPNEYRLLEVLLNHSVFLNRNNEFVLLIKNEDKLINALSFNKSTFRHFSSKPYTLTLNPTDDLPQVFCNSIHHITDSKLLNTHQVVLTYSANNLRSLSIPGGAHLILSKRDFHLALDLQIRQLAQEKKCVSSSFYYDSANRLMIIEITGFGKKPFMIEQLTEPIKGIMKKVINPGYKESPHPLDPIIMSDYTYTGSYIKHVDSISNDCIMEVPYYHELFVPLFELFSSKSKNPIKLELV